MGESVKYDTVVIGGGISGIAAALRRRKRGDKVMLLEKNEKLGGKLSVHEWEGYRWDKGPSLFTLPGLVDELFQLFGKNSYDYFQYTEHPESCRYFFNDGSKIILYKDENKRRNSLSNVFAESEVENVEAYIRNISTSYSAIGDLFTDAPKLRLKDSLRTEIIKQYPKLVSRQMLNSLNQYNERKLKNPKLVQLFNRFGTYNGSNPYKMSGLYSMIPHLELNVGTFFPKGGMREIVNSLERLAREEGVEISTDEQKIVTTKLGDEFIVHTNKGDIVTENLICSIDHVNFYDKVLRDENLLNRYKSEERSSSALVFYWAIDKTVDEVGLHNIFFSEDYEKEFKELFDDMILPAEPTIYVHNSSVVQADDAPIGCQNWFVMVNSPAGITLTEEKIQSVKRLLIKKLEEKLNVEIGSHIRHEENWTMSKIESVTGSYKGALYGAAFNSKLSSFKRHGNKSKKYKNLYFTGGSVHPGGGIPLVLKSAKIVDQLIEKNG